MTASRTAMEAGPSQGRAPFLDDLPRSAIAATSVERLDNPATLEPAFVGEWRCRRTALQLNVRFLAEDLILTNRHGRRAVDPSFAARAAVAWCHLVFHTLHDVHSALLGTRAPRSVITEAIRGAAHPLADDCAALARFAASRHEDCYAMLREVYHDLIERPMPSEATLGYSPRLPGDWERIVHTEDFRCWLNAQPPTVVALASSRFGRDAARLLAMYRSHNEPHITGNGELTQIDRPTTATEIAMRQAGVYGRSFVRSEQYRREQDGRTAALRAMIDNMAIAINPIVTLDPAEFLTAAGMNADWLIQRTFADRLAHRNAPDHAALARARDTLVACLNPAQLEQFNATGEFDVVLSSAQGWPRGRFRIRQRHTFTVRHVETGDEYCAVIEDASCPIFDQMLAMKLLLEIEPARFFATANRSRSIRVSRTGLHEQGANLAREALGMVMRGSGNDR